MWIVCASISSACYCGTCLNHIFRTGFLSFDILDFARAGKLRAKTEYNQIQSLHFKQIWMAMTKDSNMSLYQN